MTWILFPLALFSGTYGALIGAGGGFILVPILLALFPEKSPSNIVAISLFTVACHGISASLAYGFLRRIDYRTGIIFLASTIPGAIVGALTSRLLERGLFQTTVGILLVSLSLYVFLQPRLPTYKSITITRFRATRTIIDGQNERYSYQLDLGLGLFLSFAVGFISGMVGIGGGIINVPILAFLLGVPIPVAIATSQFILTATSLSATLTHFTAGHLQIEWTDLFLMTVGMVLGGQIGARLSGHLKKKHITRFLSLAIGIAGVHLLLTNL